MRGLTLRLRMVVAVVLGLAAVASVALVFQRWLTAPLDIEDQYVLTVARGAGAGSIAAQLANDGLLRRPAWFAAYARLTGQDRQIQSGEYVLDAPTTPDALLARLVAGDVKLHSFTIVEGWTVQQLLAALDRHPAIEKTLGPTDAMPLDARLLADKLGMQAAHAEGWFFPETYRFPRGTTDAEMLRRAHALMRQRLQAAWEQRAPGLPLASDYDALILASIIERETALASERPQIAGVFVRRLQQGMRLQTDPTVIYGLGAEFDGNLRRRDLRTDTPYNTYTRAGLPPTPIALPGEGALRAAVNPAEGSALFFVATGRDDGSHKFSDTLDEHNAAVAQYLATLRARRDDS